jgi:hypothetical protein
MLSRLTGSDASRYITNAKQKQMELVRGVELAIFRLPATAKDLNQTAGYELWHGAKGNSKNQLPYPAIRCQMR